MLEMPRIQEVVLPILRDAFPSAQVVSWVPQKKDRVFPIINVRRAGGYPVDPNLLDRATIELTCYGTIETGGLEETERLLLRAQRVLWNAVTNQTVIPGVGYLHSYRQTFGPTQFDSPYDDTWRIQSLIQMGLRPLPN
jgi:hypothetical protein